MRMKNLNRIRELCEWQRQSFEKNFPTGKKLSEAILKVFEDDKEETFRKRQLQFDIDNKDNSDVAI
jgi:hypothetical protein|tara:strand:+ start:489 stop:686 length:198 start_codon:yes stop_codon:yes gene_type:complete